MRFLKLIIVTVMGLFLVTNVIAEEKGKKIPGNPKDKQIKSVFGEGAAFRDVNLDRFIESQKPMMSLWQPISMATSAPILRVNCQDPLDLPVRSTRMRKQAFVAPRHNMARLPISLAKTLLTQPRRSFLPR